ncbi:hypothetical protein ACN20G_12760 [Streptomyces sp. BI20]|uniref:hypothetical protein n=1 Tax=Streptomyces sp. BI20 TaxID=3403460 RepID=UPI003C75E3F6
MRGRQEAGEVPIAELQVRSVESTDAEGGVCAVRCVAGLARVGQVLATGSERLVLRGINRAWDGAPAAVLAPPRAATVRLRGPIVPLLAPGQLLTGVPVERMDLAEAELWAAQEPVPSQAEMGRAARALAVGRMHDEELPTPRRLRWVEVALAAGAWTGVGQDPLVAAADRAAVRGWAAYRFGPAPGSRDPVSLCEEFLALADSLELTPEGAAHEGRTWRTLPRERILLLRRLRNLLAWPVSVRPLLPAEAAETAAGVDRWAAVRGLLP